jgi:Secretion system C-terminal sorting domain/WD40-like Beta Propeller Repeat
MPNLLRFCLCSFLIILGLNTIAQRTSRKRVVVVSEENSSSTTNLHDSAKAATASTANVAVKIIKKSRCELRAIPGELYSRADLIRSQKELSNHKYLVPEIKEDRITPESISFTEKVLSEEKKTMFLDCKETNAVNKGNVADSYPYLTADGLRLYFTSNREGGHGRFFISTRNNTKDPFGEPKVLSPKLTDGYYAGTLTADELTLCMVKSGAMYISVRKNTNDEFPVPVKVNGTSDNYHFGPSVSHDGKEILVTVKVNGKDMIWVYKRNALYQVEKANELAVPNGYDPGPGQLSKDGLSYYFSLNSKASEHRWRYSRNSTADNFANPIELPEQIKGLKNNLQPSLNADGSVMVFVTSPNSLWESDDIVLVNTMKEEVDTALKLASIIVNTDSILKDEVDISQQLTVVTSNASLRKVISKEALPSLKVFPNPFTATINIEINELTSEGALFNLYDLSGKIIKQQKINNERTSISFNQLSSGIYAYQIIDGKGKLIYSGKLVKSQ